MPKRDRKKRVPKLLYTDNRGIGWYVSYRDPVSNSPKKHRFGMIPENDARIQYHAWIVGHLGAEPPEWKPGRKTSPLPEAARGNGKDGKQVALSPRCLLSVALGYLQQEQTRVRDESLPRARGTISPAVFKDLRKHVHLFMDFLNSEYGQGALKRMILADLKITDVEQYNKALVDAGYSSSRVSKRMQIVKKIIDRAGRPEHGHQTLAWNWDSRQRYHGRPTKQKRLPTLKQIKRLLDASQPREQALIWMGIGLGFGPQDLSVIRQHHIDQDSYDLRRGKTGVERYGDTPPMVWKAIQAYIEAGNPPTTGPLFTTRNGYPLVHGRTNSINLWWNKLRKEIGEISQTLEGFYVLRHLGATEFGSRSGTSIGEMRRWLGHAASSQIADVYMKPVAPENRDVIEWVREALLTGKADLKAKSDRA